MAMLQAKSNRNMLPFMYAQSQANKRFEWWASLSSGERITTLAIFVGGVVGIVNSTVWAIASCYMVRQRTRLARYKLEKNLSHPKPEGPPPPLKETPHDVPDTKELTED